MELTQIHMGMRMMQTIFLATKGISKRINEHIVPPNPTIRELPKAITFDGMINKAFFIA